MLETLLFQLRQTGLTFTPRQIAEALWLAEHLPRSASAPPVESAATAEASDAVGETAPPGTACTAETSAPTDGRGVADVLPSVDTAESQKDAASTPGRARSRRVPFRSPAAPALPGALNLGRVLRPLMRRVASRTESILDEEETAAGIAEGRGFLPVLRPRPARWLEIVLIADGAPSMAPWLQTARELLRLLERHGAFSGAQAFVMQPDPDRAEGFCLLRGLHYGERKGREAGIGELISPGGHRALLVLTDGVAPYWRDGKAAAALLRWGREHPAAVLQLLPETLWDRTAFGLPTRRWRFPAPGAPNSKLIGLGPSEPGSEAMPGSLPLPLVTLDQLSLAQWASALAARRAASLPGIVLSVPTRDELEELEEEAEAFRQAESALTAPQRYARFARSATDEARALMTCLADVPLTLPVMRLAQQAIFEGQGPGPLAEVLTSGLLYRVSPAAAAPEQTLYRFHEGIQALLQEGLPSEYAARVLSRLSEWVQARLDRPRDFAAYLALPTTGETDGEERALPDYLTPFAQIPESVLARYRSNLADSISTPTRADQPSDDVEDLRPAVTPPAERDWRRRLEKAKEIRNTRSRGRTLAELAVELPAELLSEALETVRALPAGYGRTRALAAMAARLTGAALASAISEALSDTESVGSANDRLELIREFDERYGDMPLVRAWLEREAVADADERARRLALDKLAARYWSDPAMCAWLQEQATSQRRRDVRASAIRALGAYYFSDRRIVAFLRERGAADGSVVVRMEAVLAVGKTDPHDPETRKWLFDRAHEDAHPGVRREALAATERGRIIAEPAAKAEDAADGDSETVAIAEDTLSTDFDWNNRLDEIEAMKSGRERGRALADVAADLPLGYLGRALHISDEIQSRYGKSLALANLVLRLRISKRYPILEKALHAAREIPGDVDRCQILIYLVPLLPMELLQWARTMATELKPADLRAQLYADIAAHLSDKDRTEDLDHALNAANHIQDRNARALFLERVAPLLSLSQLERALVMARITVDEPSGLRAVNAIQAHLGGQSPVQTEPSRAERDVAEEPPGDTSGIATAASDSEPAQTAAVDEHVEDWSGRLAQVLRIRDGRRRGQALADLAAHLPETLVSEALDAAHAIGSDFGRCLALAAVAGRLPSGPRRATLGVAVTVSEKLESVADRRQALVAIAGAAEPDQRRQVLVIVETLDDPLQRALAFMDIAALMGPDRRDEVYVRALADVRSSVTQVRKSARSRVQAGPSAIEVLIALTQAVPVNLLDLALDVAVQFPNPVDLVRFLREAGPRLSAPLLVRAHGALQKHRSIDARADGLMVLVAYLPEGARDLPVREVLDLIPQIVNDYHRINILQTLAPYLHGETYQRALGSVNHVRNVSMRQQVASALQAGAALQSGADSDADTQPTTETRIEQPDPHTSTVTHELTPDALETEPGLADADGSIIEQFRLRLIHTWRDTVPSGRIGGVLFVPDLDEPWESTWSHTAASARSGDFWPSWLSSDLNDSMPGVDVWCLETPARTNAPLTVQQQAAAILAVLDRETQGCPLLIIASGTGGLLACHLLQLSADSTSSSLRSVADNALGLLLLSPPFHGFRFVQSHPELDRDGPFLQQLRSWLRTYCSETGRQVRIYYDSRSDPVEVDPDIPGVTPLVFDRSGLNKIPSRRDPVYVAALQFVKEAIAAGPRLQAQQQEPVRAEQRHPDPETEAETGSADPALARNYIVVSMRRTPESRDAFDLDFSTVQAHRSGIIRLSPGSRATEDTIGYAVHENASRVPWPSDRPPIVAFRLLPELMALPLDRLTLTIGGADIPLGTRYPVVVTLPLTRTDTEDEDEVIRAWTRSTLYNRPTDQQIVSGEYHGEQDAEMLRSLMSSPGMAAACVVADRVAPHLLEHLYSLVRLSSVPVLICRTGAQSGRESPFRLMQLMLGQRLIDLPYAVQHLRREAALSTDPDHPGRSLTLYWPDPLLMPGAAPSPLYQ